MKQYIVTIQHDKGTTKIRVIAANEEAAKQMVMKAENCPASAITKVRRAAYNRIS